MIRIEIQADDAQAAHAEILSLLQGYQGAAVAKDRQYADMVRDESAAEKAPEPSAPAKAADSDGGGEAPAPVSSSDDKPKRRGRGRPKKEDTSPAEGPASSADSSDSQPAVEGNTGSAPEGLTPTSEGAPESGDGGTEGAVSASGSTEPMGWDEFKQACQGDGLDNDQVMKLIDLLEKNFGTSKLKEVPEDRRREAVAMWNEVR